MWKANAGDGAAYAAKLAVSCAALIAWAAFIFFMSANDGDASTGLSDGVIVWLANAFWPGYPSLSPADQLAFVESLSFPVRKLAHFSEYAVLGLLAFATLLQANTASRLRRPCAASVADASPERSPNAGRASDEASTATRAGASRALAGAPMGRGREGLAHLGALAVAFSFLYACLDEFHQLFVDGRCGQPADVAVDTSGALVAVAIALLALRHRARCSSRKAP